jgi:hypothetical protein
VLAAWWVVVEGFADLAKCRQIDVRPDGDKLKLVLGGNGQPGLLRIKLFLLVD